MQSAIIVLLGLVAVASAGSPYKVSPHTRTDIWTRSYSDLFVTFSSNNSGVYYLC